jgi:hypothetical protein
VAEEGNTITVDAAGNVIVGGYVDESVDFGCGAMAGGPSDWPFLLKLDPQGNCLWSHIFTVTQSGVTAIMAGVVTDAAGDVYVASVFFGSVDFGGGALTSAGGSDVAIAKYDKDGVFQWAHRYGDAQNQEPDGIALDSAGNVVVAGDFYGSIDFGGGPITSAGQGDVFVAKLSPSGAYLWDERFGDASNQQPYAVAVDAQDNIVLAGQFTGTLDFGGGPMTSAGLYDIFVAKLTPSGSHLWSKRFGSTGSDAAVGVAVDDAGDVYASGYFGTGTFSFGGPSVTNQGGQDVFLVKLDPSGNYLWNRAMGGAGNQFSYAVGVDQFGNAAVAGGFASTIDLGGGPMTSAGTTDIFVAKYDAGGNYLWAKGFGGTAYQAPNDATMDAAGNVYVTGTTSGPVDFGAGPIGGFGSEDIWILKLGP